MISSTYIIKPINKLFGAFIYGINLNNPLDEKTIHQIKEDLVRYRLLIFKEQQKVTALKQIEISEWFGEIESTFYKHPASPHPDIFRVSNDEKEGCRNVGISGWHIDGTFLEAPFKIQTMHFWSTSKKGATEFSPMKEVILSLPEKVRDQWEKLYFVSNQGEAIHPLIYSHPETKQPTLCIHTGEPFIQTFLVNFDSQTMRAEKIMDWQETQATLCDIAERLSNPSLVYRCNWEPYDFAIIDNLAIAHKAVLETQTAPKQDGLRILHRTSVKGEHKPIK